MTTPATKETLFSLTDDLLALDQILTESGGELTPEVEQWMTEYRDKFTAKVDGLGWYWRTCEAREAGYRKAAAELADKAQTEANKVTRLKEYARACLDHLGATKVAGDIYTLAIQKNGGRTPLKVCEPFLSDPSRLPAEYQRIVVLPDLEKLRTRAELSCGVATMDDRDGTAMAELLPAGTHVRLR